MSNDFKAIEDYKKQFIDHFNYLSNNFKYGYIRNGKPETENWDDFDKCWKYRSVNQIKKDKVGICYDYSLLTFDEFNDKSWCELIPVFFHAKNDSKHELATHTVCFIRIINKENEVVAIESAWDLYKGVHQFDSIKQGMFKYKKYLEKQYESNYDYAIKFYNPLDKKLFGKTQIEFEKYIIEHGIDFKNNVIVSYGNVRN